MTHEQFKQLKSGDTLYVTFIDEIAESQIGTSTIGSDTFERYSWHKLKVEDTQIHDYDPDHTQQGWRHDLTVQFLKFDISHLSEKQQNFFHKTFREYFPVYTKACDDVKQYAGYFEVPYNRHLELTEDNYSYELSAITLLSKTKREAIKITNKMNRLSIQRIDSIIRYYRQLKPQVVKFIKGDKQP